MREPATDEQIMTIALSVLKSYPTQGVTLKDLRIITCELVRDDYKLDRSRVAMIVATIDKTEIKGRREAMHHEPGWVMPPTREEAQAEREAANQDAGKYSEPKRGDWRLFVYGGQRGDR